jgi:hypothetical protein
MSTDWLKFQGRVDLHVSWGEVASVQQAGDDLIVSLHETRRQLRFCCAGAEDAARATAVGRHLAELAHADPVQTV